MAPLDFGAFSHDLLIGQFAGGGDTQSSGFIAAYDFATGQFEGVLQDLKGKPLAINGLWSLVQGMSAHLIMILRPRLLQKSTSPLDRIMAPGGLFGYLTAVSAELTEGNAQQVASLVALLTLEGVANRCLSSNSNPHFAILKCLI